MARKLLAQRPRAHTTTDSISQPTLTFTDAASRSDFQPLGQVSANMSSNGPKRSNTLAVDVARSHRHDKDGRPQTSPGPEDTYPDDQFIGIALGSPRVARGMGYISGGSIPTTITDASEIETQNSGSGNSDTPGLKRKPSKWKKFGDLFKPKAAPAMPIEAPPFYQVQINDQPLLPSRYPSFIKDYSSEYSYGAHHHIMPPSRRDDEKDKITPRKHTKLTKEQNHPVPQKHWGALSDEPADVSTSERRGPPPSNLLGVDIPDVEMERYSVMFGNLLGKPQSSTLLARRSKTLDNLMVHEEEDDDEEKRPSLPRRATSPARTKSPSFSIFPATTTTKLSKIHGSHCVPRGNSPAPSFQARPAPPREEYSNPQLMNGAEAPQEPLPSSHARLDSEVSFLSSTGSEADSITDEKAILLGLKPAPVVDEKEPEWEIISSAKLTRKNSTPEEEKETPASETTTSLSKPQNPSSPPRPTREPPSVPTLLKSPSPAMEPTTITPSFPPRSTSRASQPHPHSLPPPIPVQTPEITISAEEPPDPESQVSVARSISVSKRQKHMLVPISGGSVRRVRGQGHERVVERRVVTPTLVAVRGHSYKKSENVVIERI